MAELLNLSDGYATESEERAAELFRSLPDNWLVVANKYLPVRHGQTFEIDFIIVSEHRIIIVDDKHWRGPILGTDTSWFLKSSGETRRSPFNTVDKYARNLVGFLENKGLKLPYNKGVKPIVGSVFASFPGVTISVSDPRAEHCLFVDSNVIAKLKWLDDEGARAELDVSSARSQIRTALFDPNDRQKPTFPKQFNAFRVEERLDQRGDCSVYQAVNDLDGERYHLYVYEQRSTADTEQLDREVNALQLLRTTNVVPQVQAPLDVSDFGTRAVPVLIPKGVSWGALDAPRSEDEALAQLDLTRIAFEGLARVHKSGEIVHRSLDAGNVIVDESLIPPTVTFTGFLFARIQDKETIALAIDAQNQDDPYAAPEIRKMGSYSFAEQSSDVYSLALVALERLMGVGVNNLVSSLGESSDLPVGSAYWPYLNEEIISELRAAFLEVLNSGPYFGSERMGAKAFADRLKAIQEGVEKHEQITPADSKYRFIRELGRGAFATTSLVEHTDTGVLAAAKKYRETLSAEDKERLKREFLVLYQHPHKNLPKSFAPPDMSHPDVQFALEFIEGETLAAHLDRQPLDRDVWANVMRGIVDAVQHLESHGIVHRDIKPENIVIRERDGEAILIDFGSAIFSDQRASNAGSPAYMAPEILRGEPASSCTDLYATVVTLFEAASRALPFQAANSVFDKTPLEVLPSSVPYGMEDVCYALLKAVAPDPANRFANATELRNALENALVVRQTNRKAAEEEEPYVPDGNLNEWVENLRGLFRNSARGNSDNRGLDSEFARDSYVKTKLDTHLWPAILKFSPAVVFLSGNPGDGKTAFLEAVRTYLVEAGANPEQVVDLSGWELELNGRTYRACFDASEASNGRSADAQLKHRLRGIEGQDPSTDTIVLVAINDGRLAEVVENFDETHPWLVDHIQEARSRSLEGTNLTAPVWIVDLKRRAYVSLNPLPDGNSVMREMLETMVNPAWWTGDKVIADEFPPSANAIALRNPEIAARVEYLLLLAHLRGDRHTTVRDLRSALALLITGDLSWERYKELQEGGELKPWTYRYWNLVFTTDSTRDLVLGDLFWLDPARFAHPELERYLYFHRRAEDASERAKLFVNGTDEPPPAGDDPEMIREWMAAVKRRLVFEGAIMPMDAPVRIDPLNLLPYESARETIAVLGGKSDGRALLDRILTGISRSDGTSPANDRKGELLLQVKRADELNLRIAKTLPLDRFSLRTDVVANDDEIVEVTPRTLRLTYKNEESNQSALIRLNLDVIEVLSRLADGQDANSPEQGPYLEELSPFKSRLQRDMSDRLVVIDGLRTHWIEKRGDRIIRGDAQNDGIEER